MSIVRTVQSVRAAFVLQYNIRILENSNTYLCLKTPRIPHVLIILSLYCYENLEFSTNKLPKRAAFLYVFYKRKIIINYRYLGETIRVDNETVENTSPICSYVIRSRTAEPFTRVRYETTSLQHWDVAHRIIWSIKCTSDSGWKFFLSENGFLFYLRYLCANARAQKPRPGNKLGGGGYWTIQM